MNSANDVWSKVLRILSEDLTSTAISTWFDECRAVEISDNRLFLHTPSTFQKNVIEGRFSGNIKSALGELFSGDFDVVVLDDDGLAARTDAAALAVGEGRQKQNYNPLFIYGESGLGKTHLLHAIRHAVAKNFPHYSIVYVKAEDFTNEFIHALQLGKNVEFRERHRAADMLLMDDIQFLAGKIQTQEEFFHTFNTLYELGKQIVFTSDRPPNEIHRLEDRLRGRFQSGLLADIQPPDDALRVAIINKKAEQLGVMLPNDVTEYIAESITSSVRQLEGAVKMIIAYKDIMDDDITVETVKNRLKDIFKGSKDLIPTADSIIEETAKYYTLTPDDVKSQRRTRDTTLARQIAMFLIRKLTNLSLNDIGLVFARDHSTVISSIRRVEHNIEASTDFAKIIKDITSNINSRD
jgi:chromosomal replication initiator protein